MQRAGQPATCAGIFKQSIGARNQVGIGLSYQPARLHSLVELVHWIRFLGSLKFENSGSGIKSLPGSRNRKHMTLLLLHALHTCRSMALCIADTLSCTGPGACILPQPENNIIGLKRLIKIKSIKQVEIRMQEAGGVRLKS